MKGNEKKSDLIFFFKCFFLLYPSPKINKIMPNCLDVVYGLLTLIVYKIAQVTLLILVVQVFVHLLYSFSN